MSVSATQYELWPSFVLPSLHYISKVSPKWNHYRACLIYFPSDRIALPVVQYLKVVIFCLLFGCLVLMVEGQTPLYQLILYG